jgi:hypothetical protein
MNKFTVGSLMLLSACAVGCADRSEPGKGKGTSAIKPHAPEALAVGKVAPDIVGEDIDGKEFKLSDYRGKVVVLDFWGNW